MREIKFRVWSKKFNEFLNRDGDSYLLSLEGSLYFDDGHDLSFIGRNEYIVNQYTGLKDKNGVEIYEGDIVRFKVENQSQWIGSNIGIVTFNKQTVSFEILLDKKIYLSINRGYDAYIGTLDIMGNIHENPLLLLEEELDQTITNAKNKLNKILESK